MNKGLICACLAALCFNSTAMAKTKTVTLRVLETSDVHGAFFAYDYLERKEARGSMARVASYVKRLRSEHGSNVILLDNGDILQGQPTCYYYNFINPKMQNVAAKIINYLQYDAQTWGNHDVETGHAVYDKWTAEVGCPMLGANVINTANNEQYLKPYTIINRNGVKIAVLGLITPAIPNWLTEDIWKGLRFENMRKTAEHWMNIIRQKENPDVVIGLFHSGKQGGIQTAQYDENATMDIARHVPGFDVIFYGHDHVEACEWVENTEGKRVLLLNPANNAINITDATISVTKKGKKLINKSISGKVQNICNEQPDADYEKYFAADMDSVKAYVSRQIGYFDSDMRMRDCYMGSAAFADFIHNMQLEITGADISLNAPLSLDAVINKGPVYVSDMFKLYRYENQLYTMLLSGKEIRKHLEMSYDLWVNTMTTANDPLFRMQKYEHNGHTLYKFANLTFNFDTAAGIIYEVDVTRPDGQKVSIKSMADGTPFDENKMYKVAVNSYRGNGGGELLTRGAGIPKDSLESRVIARTKLDQRYYLMKLIEQKGHVNPQPNNNWRFVPEAIVKPAMERDSKLIFK